MMEEAGISLENFGREAEALALAGKTPLFFAESGRLLGLVAVADTPKPTSADAVEMCIRDSWYFTLWSAP